jgi:Ulp1 family protease
MNYNVGINNSPNISVFHFNSLPTQTKSIACAEEYDRYVFQLTKAEKSKAFEVPVPFQPASSNDCGHYPAHFLKIFLKDIDKAIKFCVKVG